MAQQEKQRSKNAKIVIGLGILFTVAVLTLLSLIVSGCTQTPAGSGSQAPAIQHYGPIVKDIGTGTDFVSIGFLSPGQRVEFNFSASGAQVRYWVVDEYKNIIFTGAGGGKVQEGGGSFTASGSGWYYLKFSSTGILTPSVLTIYYNVYD